MAPYILKLPVFTRIEIIYTLYPKTKRKCDVANVLSVVDKYFSDALVEFGRIEDDNYDFIPKVVYEMGEVDKEWPRATITIKEI